MTTEATKRAEEYARRQWPNAEGAARAGFLEGYRHANLSRDRALKLVERMQVLLAKYEACHKGKG